MVAINDQTDKMTEGKREEDRQTNSTYLIKADSEHTEEIDISEIIHMLWHKLWLIVLCAGLVGGLAWCGTKYLNKTTYMARVVFCITNEPEDSTSISLNEINTAQKLVSTYIEVLKSNTVLKKIVEKSNYNYNVAQLQQMISAGMIDETAIIEVQITASNEEDAKTLANVIVDICPYETQKIVKAGHLEVVDKADDAVIKVEPNYLVDTMIGIIIGAGIACLMIAIVNMTSNRIKRENDIRKKYSLMVLGVVPSM